MYGLRTGVGLYLPGEGHEHLGPGTSMVQRVNAYAGQYGGMGAMHCTDYVGMGECANYVGMGCANYVGMGCQQTGLGCACGGSGGGRLTCGVGCNDLAEYRGVSGLGLFDSGIDFTQWGVAEWGIAAVAGYLFISLAGDTRRAATSVKRTVRRRRRRAEGAA